jgi:ferredoxin
VNVRTCSLGVSPASYITEEATRRSQNKSTNANASTANARKKPEDKPKLLGKSDNKQPSLDPKEKEKQRMIKEVSLEFAQVAVKCTHFFICFILFVCLFVCILFLCTRARDVLLRTRDDFLFCAACDWCHRVCFL